MVEWKGFGVLQWTNRKLNREFIMAAESYRAVPSIIAAMGRHVPHLVEAEGTGLREKIHSIIAQVLTGYSGDDLGEATRLLNDRDDANAQLAVARAKAMGSVEGESEDFFIRLEKAIKKVFDPNLA